MKDWVRACVLWLVMLAEFFLGWGANSRGLAQSGGATTGELSGSVTDIQEIPVAGVAVTARRTETNLTRQTQTDEAGRYFFLLLPPGSYEIRVEAPGFAPQSATVAVTIGTAQTAGFRLALEQTKDIVEVYASDDSFAKNHVRRKTESSTIINQVLINGLPINQRDFLDYSRTAARVTEDRIPAQGVSTTSKLSFNGQVSRLNNISVDGLDNNDRGVGSVRGTFSQEAVREFQIVSDNFSAEFGRSLGGVINIVTRGGTNELHGTGFGFFRTQSLSARDPFSILKPPFEQDQFGLVLGGPVKRDKAFYFTSFERRSIQQNNIVTIRDATIASAARQGFGVRNGPVPFSFGSSTFLGRLDANLTPNLTMWLRYNGTFTYDGNFEPYGGLTAETATGISRASENVGAASFTYLNPKQNLVNETRILVSRYSQLSLPVQTGVQVNLVAPEGLAVFGQGTTVPSSREVKPIQLVNQTTWVQGSHHFRFGVDFLRSPGNARVGFLSGGVATFSPLVFSTPGGQTIRFSGIEAFDPTQRTSEQLAFLKFLAVALPIQFPAFPTQVRLDRLGLPLSYVQSFGTAKESPLTTDFSAFAQDEWTLRSNLLVKLGVRYDRDRFSNELPPLGSVSPRLALSYNPGWLRQVNVRLGYGLFYAAPLAVAATFAEAQKHRSIQGFAIPFPFSVLPFGLPGHGYPAGQEVPANIPNFPQLGVTIKFDPHLKPAYSQQGVVEINWGFRPDWRFSSTYNMALGRHIAGIRNINPIVRPIPGNPLESALTGRVDPSQGVVQEFESAFSSSFHALTLGVEHFPNSRLQVSAHYTLAKAIDNYLDPIRFDLSIYNDPLQPGLDRSLSVQDVRHRVVFTGRWEPVFSKHILLRNYELSSIIRLESGRPYNLLAGVDLNLNGDTPPADRPLVNGVPLGRNLGITPGFASVDFRMTRKIKLNERLTLQLLGEAFNLLNRTNINQVDNIFPPDETGNFHLPKQVGGRYVTPPERRRSAFSPRQFQLGFRLSF
ncbi:MAG: TonB-dependent receptor [Blastocatellia bacterium]|nr:TonB-dependent receptor [Blastocatellia bacterium]